VYPDEIPNSLQINISEFVAKFQISNQMSKRTLIAEDPELSANNIILETNKDHHNRSNHLYQAFICLLKNVRADPHGAVCIDVLSLNVGKPITSILQELANLVDRIAPDFFFLQEVHVTGNRLKINMCRNKLIT